MSTTRPTRSQVLGAIVTEAILQARLTWRGFTAAVVDHYHATTAVADRVLEFHVATTAENYEHVARLNTQTLQRMISGENRLPADLEDSLLAALPQAWRERALTELLDRAGLMVARKPAAGAAGAVVGPCELMRHTADVLQPLAQALADGVIDANDAPQARQAMESVGKLMGACVQVEVQLSAALQAGEMSRRPARSVR